MKQLSPISELQKQAELLRLEMKYETEAYAHSLTHLQFASLVQEPSCRYPVTLGNTTYNALDQTVATVSFEVSDDEPDTDFEPGKVVAFFTFGDNGTPRLLPHQFYIDQVDTGILTIAIPNQAALQSLRSTAQMKLLGIQTSIDTTSY